LLDMHILVDKDMTVEDGHRLCEQAAALIQRKMPMVLEVMTHMEPDDSVDIVIEIEKLARQVKGVKGVHNIRVRNILSGYDVDLHVLVEPSLSVADGHDICTQGQHDLTRRQLKIVSVLTHLEPYSPTQVGRAMRDM
ncbi:MAG: hypothetical protein MJ106_01950, partial [Lentisphaeria bacterium]|nr:hypothetical protein [Lentisphaeria bacterium]